MKPLTIPSFTKLLKVRTVIKRVQQMSWTLSKFEDKFPLENANESDVDNIVNTYVFVLDELEDILNEVKSELKGNEKKAK